MMNTTELTGNWAEQKAELRQKFAALTNNDLLFEKGKSEELLERIQAKLGKTKEEIFKIIGEI